MQLPNTGNQSGLHPLYVADSTITTGGTSQLLLPRAASRSHLLVMNLSTANLFMEVGDARATAALTSGRVSSLTVTNGGFGYTRAPQVWFFGGWNQNNTAFVASGQPNYPAPPHPAQAHAVLTNGVVTSIVIDDPGALYTVAPMVFLSGDPIDPNGAADPYFSSVSSGIILLPQGGSYYMNGTCCPTTPISIWGGTSTQAFTCRWMA